MSDEKTEYKRHINFVFTLNNFHLKERQHERLMNPAKWPEYVRCVQYGIEHNTEEEIEQGMTPHLQGFITLWSEQTHKKLGLYWLDKNAMWWEGMKGPLTANENYCSKETSLIVIGDKPLQGRRTDIITVKRKIDEDPTKMIWDLADDNEHTFKTVMRNYRALGEYARHKLRKLHLSMKHTPVVYVLYGPSRTGKSEWLQKLVGAENVAVMPPPTSTWWIDEYVARSKYILVDEITTQRVPPIDMFLNWCDKLCKPYNTKGGSSTMRPEIIVFTSNLHPGLWWPDMDLEHIQAVCERMTGGIYRTRKNHEPHLEFKWGEGFKEADFYSEAELDSYRQWYASGTSHIKL